MAPRIVLVLDNDLGFVFSLAAELEKRQIAALPARSTQEAHSVLTRFDVEPNVLVLNCGSPGACAFAEELAHAHSDLRIIGIVTENDRCQSCASLLNAQFQEPEGKTPSRIPDCADTIQSLLSERSGKIRRAGGSEKEMPPS